jgi:ligand-binding SRPBCC domain-containing protein
MPVIALETLIHAPIEHVFDLARSIDLHAETMSSNRERAVEGVTKGLIRLDETVTWEAVHFGIRQRLTSKITICDRPSHLQDIMVSGAFARFTHDHYFLETESGTLMKDVFDYLSPLGFIGRMADELFLERYMTRLLAERNRLIKLTAESDDWRRFIPDEEPSSE